MMKALFLFGALSAAAVVACSGDDGAPIAEENFATEVIAPGAAPGAGDAGARSDAAAKPRPPKGDGGTAPDGATEEAPADKPADKPAPKPKAELTVDDEGCANEREPNDTAAAADPLPGGETVYCGGMATAADVDVASFVLPEDADRLRIRFERSSGVTATVTVDGRTFRAGVDEPPVVPGGRYTIRVTTTRGQATYRLEIEPN